MTMNNVTYTQVEYTVNYEPADLKTLRKLVKLDGPFVPIFHFDLDVGEAFSREVNIKFGTVPTIIDTRQDKVWMLILGEVYMFKMFHTVNMNFKRYCLRIDGLTKLNDQQYLDNKHLIGIDFEAGKANKRQYKRMLESCIDRIDTDHLDTVNEYLTDGDDESAGKI